MLSIEIENGTAFEISFHVPMVSICKQLTGQLLENLVIFPDESVLRTNSERLFTMFRIELNSFSVYKVNVLHKLFYVCLLSQNYQNPFTMDCS